MQGFTEPGYEGAHVHELIGSVKVADFVCPAHNHRIAAVTGPPIPEGGGGHAHEVSFLTDSFEGHSHAFDGKTGGEVPVSGDHVHYMEGMVACSGAHRHCFGFATLIADPISE